MDMVCFGNTCMDTLHKGDNDGDDNNHNNLSWPWNFSDQFHCIFLVVSEAVLCFLFKSVFILALLYNLHLSYFCERNKQLF